MAKLGKFIELTTNKGDPVIAGEKVVTPFSQALVVRLPFGGFVWNRPLAIRVEEQGQSYRIAIVDVTLAAQFVIAMAGLLLVLIYRFISGQSSS